MNNLYTVPVVINAKLEFLTVPHIPTVVADRDTHVELPSLICVLRETKRILAEMNHDNYLIKINQIQPCK